MKKLTTWFSAFTGLIMLFRSGHAGAETISNSTSGDYLVLLHGMGRTARSMIRLEFYFTRQGYRVINVTYNSKQNSVEELAENFLHPLLQKCNDSPTNKIHFVTHSLGGIIIRQYLSEHSLPNLGRIVMLAPPNHGSEIIDRLRDNKLTCLFLGASARELGTRAEDLPNRLGAAHFECGIIAGDRSFNPFFSAILSGPDDGKVTVSSTRLAGMRDFFVMHSTHTWLMWRTQTLRETLAFLQTGHFIHFSTESHVQ